MASGGGHTEARGSEAVFCAGLLRPLVSEIRNSCKNNCAKPLPEALGWEVLKGTFPKGTLEFY